jgi:hypothetical protein
MNDCLFLEDAMSDEARAEARVMLYYKSDRNSDWKSLSLDTILWLSSSRRT